MIVFINGSKKMKDSNSEYFLNIIKHNLENHECVSYDLKRQDAFDEIVKSILKSESLVIAMPLYVDSIPSHVLKFMEYMAVAKEHHNFANIQLYVIANCGFYEGIQNEILVNTMKCWCERMGMKWGQGLGIGSGEMLGGMRSMPLGKGPTKNLQKALLEISHSIRQRESKEDVFIEPNYISQKFFLMFANQFWNEKAKKNGLKKKEL